MSKAEIRRWRLWVLIFWLLASAILVALRWPAIEALALSDTDDNLRLAQVRALLAGQRWSDLAQYRLGGPQAFDIHWSRIVDLPLAAIILALEPLAGREWAERIAATMAPLLAMGAAMAAMAVTARRLIAPGAFALALATLLAAPNALAMWMPTRIDHHGWQLALLALLLAGIADPRRARGGIAMGLASSLSLGIGLEMLPYVAAAGAAALAGWAWDAREG
ncbi:MAG: AcrB/AcrD/AcrF family protein, partial [Sphingomonadaceae bacterium]